MRTDFDIAVHLSPKNLNSGVWYRRNWKIYSCRRPSHWRPRESCMEPRAFFSHHGLAVYLFFEGHDSCRSNCREEDCFSLCQGRLRDERETQNLDFLSSLAWHFVSRNRLNQISARSEYAITVSCETFSLSAWRLTLSLVSGVLLHCSLLSNSELFHNRDYNCSLPATFNELRKLRRVKSQQCKLKLFCFWCVCSSYQLTFYEVKRYNYCFMLPARWMVLSLVSKASKPLCNIYVFDIFKRFCVINFHWLQNQEGFDCRTLHLFCYCLDIN